MEHIVFFSHHIGGFGGVQTFMNQMAEKFCADGYKVHLIGICSPKQNGYYKSDNAKSYTEHVLFYEDVFLSKPWKLLGDMFLFRQAAREVQQILESCGSYRIIITNPLAFLILRSVDLSKSKKTIVQFHGSASELAKGKGLYLLYRKLIKRYYKQSDHFLLLSASDAALAQNCFGWQHIAYIPNPCPKHGFEVQFEKERRDFIVLSRMDKWKRVESSIKAFLFFSQRNPGYSLRIYGIGPCEQKLKALAAKSNFPNKIIFEGYCDDLSTCFQNAVALLITSKSEGLPFSLLESLSINVPVISFDCSESIAEVLKSSDGLLVEKNNIFAMAEAMERLVRDQAWQKQLAEKMPAMVSKFDMEVVSQRWYELFQS